MRERDSTPHSSLSFFLVDNGKQRLQHLNEMMNQRIFRKNGHKRYREGPMWSLARTSGNLENEQRRLQQKHNEEDREGFGGKVVSSLSVRGEVVSTVVYSPHELESMATVYLGLVKDLQEALMQKWERSRRRRLGRGDETNMFLNPQHRDVSIARKRLAMVHLEHSKRLLQTEHEGSRGGGTLLTNKDLHRGTWCLLLSYLSDLALPSLLELVKTFVFHRPEEGRVLELLIRKSYDGETSQQQVLQEDGSGLFSLVDLMQDATCDEQGTEGGGLSSTSQERPLKRRRTGVGATPSKEATTHRLSSSNPVPLPVSLMMLWIHLVDRELASKSSQSLVSLETDSSQSIVRLERLEKRLGEIRFQDRSQFLYEDALRLFLFERLLLYPENSPLTLEEAVAKVISHG